MNNQFLKDELEWIPDTSEYRAYHNQKLQITEGGVDQGIFLMQVSEVGPNGERKEGHILLSVTPTTPNNVQPELN